MGRSLVTVKLYLWSPHKLIDMKQAKYRRLIVNKNTNANPNTNTNTNTNTSTKNQTFKTNCRASDDNPVPIFLSRCIQYIELEGLRTEGLYRYFVNYFLVGSLGKSLMIF